MPKTILDYDTVALDDGDSSLIIIDQTKLPNDLVMLHLRTQKEIYDAIYLLEVRGAPAIGVAAAYGIYLAAKGIDTDDYDEFATQFDAAKDYLASHFKELCLLNRCVEVLAHEYLTMFGKEHGIVVLHGFHHSMCQFRRAGTIIRDDRHFLAYMAWQFGCYVQIFGFGIHAGNSCGTNALAMKHHIHIGPVFQNCEVEATLHRRTHTVERLSCLNVANRHLVFTQFRNPRPCGRNERHIAYAPREVAARATCQTMITYLAGRSHECTDLFFTDVHYLYLF